MGFWRREDDLERELRANRPEPRRELVDEIARMAAGRPRSTGRKLRFGVAVALTAAMLGVLGASGGLSYAAGGVTQAVHSAVHAVVPTKAAKPSEASIAFSSATAQYRVTLCFHGFTLQVDSHFARLLEALGASPGACKPKHRGHGGVGRFTPATKKVVMCFNGKNTVVAKSEEKSLEKLHFKAGFCTK